MSVSTRVAATPASVRARPLSGNTSEHLSSKGQAKTSHPTETHALEAADRDYRNGLSLKRAYQHGGSWYLTSEVIKGNPQKSEQAQKTTAVYRSKFPPGPGTAAPNLRSETTSRVVLPRRAPEASMIRPMATASALHGKQLMRAIRDVHG